MQTRPFTLEHLLAASAQFVQAQPAPMQPTFHEALAEFLRHLQDQEPAPEPDAADQLFRAGKDAFLRQQDPFRGLSKKAREIATEIRSLIPPSAEPSAWREVLRKAIESGELFAKRGAGEKTIRELCRLVVSPIA